MMYLIRRDRIFPNQVTINGWVYLAYRQGVKGRLKLNIKGESTMIWSEWLEEWGMSSLKINIGFAQMEFKPQDADRDAAWEMYIELLTRITTQAFPAGHGDEATALQSVYSLFATTREIIKRHKRHALEFTKIAIIVLNQVVRPFTAKWHKPSIENTFADQDQAKVFREELVVLQQNLAKYTAMAGVEDDLLLLEQVSDQT